MDITLRRPHDWQNQLVVLNQSQVSVHDFGESWSAFFFSAVFFY
jgi:hypothetical protein